MIYNNTIGDTFTQFYKEVVKLRKTLAEIENVINRIEQVETQEQP